MVIRNTDRGSTDPGSTDPAADPAQNTLVASPCVRLCTLDDDDVCLGCFRNIIEICAWGGAGEAQRRQIVRAANARRYAKQRRG